MVLHSKGTNSIIHQLEKWRIYPEHFLGNVLPPTVFPLKPEYHPSVHTNSLVVALWPKHGRHGLYRKLKYSPPKRINQILEIFKSAYQHVLWCCCCSGGSPPTLSCCCSARGGRPLPPHERPTAAAAAVATIFLTCNCASSPTSSSS